jgi:eukaryotic-like serine/threonine-protein kinase
MNPTNQNKFQIGQLIANRFKLKHIIGQGAMGCVYYAEDIVQKGKAYAIKFLYPHLMNDNTLQRFSREAQICSQLSKKSRNIVQVLAYGVHEQKIPYYVMELLEGKTLLELLEEKPISLVNFLNITRQICMALYIAHKGVEINNQNYPVIHRDLKPANILLVTDPQYGVLVKVLDFGIAKLIGDEVQLTQGQQFIGTLVYCSPEQIGGDKIDFYSDIYSLGVLMFQLITGEDPWGESQNNKSFSYWFKTHLSQPPRYIKDVKPNLNIPPELEYLIRKCLEKKPSDRPKSVEEILRILNQIVANISKHTAQTPIKTPKNIPQTSAPKKPEVINKPEPENKQQKITELERKLKALDVFCLQASWPKNQPIAKIVFPQVIKYAELQWSTLWVMLPEKEIQLLKEDKILPENHRFLNCMNPYPMLLWLSVVYGDNHDPKWLPCFLDLKSNQGKAIASLLVARGIYKVLFFPQEQPGRCDHVLSFSLNNNERLLLKKLLEQSEFLLATNEGEISKKLLRVEYEKIKPIVLGEIAAKFSGNVSDQAIVAVNEKSGMQKIMEKTTSIFRN